MDGGSNTPANTPAAPELIDSRYRLSGPIGRGGMASVYSARDEKLGRDVAVKLFSPQMADTEDLRRYRAEIELVAKFNHPGLVTLFDAGPDQPTSGESSPFLIMELVDGEDLRSRIQQGVLTQRETAMVGVGVSAALAYVHGRSVIHRDIKPANILLARTKPGEPLNPKLTDFGIARMVDGTRLTAAGTMVGTAAYLSPEQVTGADLSPASDIYSLGLVLLECLTGKVEFQGNAVEAAVARLHRSPVVPSDFGFHWKELLRAMTAMEPSGRPTAAAVQDSLQQALSRPIFAPGALKTDGTTVLPAPPPHPPGWNPTMKYSIPLKTSAPAKHSPRARFLALCALLGIAAIVSVVILSVSSPTPSGPPVYPSVSGTLGEHLEQLRKSITP